MTTPNKTLLVLGATSDIGRAIAARYAKAGWSIVLAARTLAAAEREARDLSTRAGAAVRAEALDVLDLEAMIAFSNAFEPLPDTVLSVVGVLGDQDRAQRDERFAAEVMRANFEGPALALGAFGRRMEQRGHGTLIGVSSVAGERGRASNYVYGSAKAGFTAFLSGLRHRLSKRGVRVLTIKPGFVRTRMTEAMTLPGALTASASEVGEAVFNAAEGGKADVVYVRWMWRWIMSIIKFLPEPIFKKSNL